MTASKAPSILTTARSDPLGAGIIVCVIVLLVLLALEHAPKGGTPEQWAWRWPAILSGPYRVPPPLESPPAAWRQAARRGDILTVPGLPVSYWGKPDASYGERVTAAAAKPVAIVIHYTDETPMLRLVRYGHGYDDSRGGAFGYHFYIDPAGRVVQGAPLSKRTNHIKPTGASVRRATAPHLDSSNTIGVTLVGACKSPRYSPITYRCSEETPTQEQIAAGKTLVQALRQRYGISCGEIYGHGDLQHDRASFEGHTLSRAARC